MYHSGCVQARNMLPSVGRSGCSQDHAPVECLNKRLQFTYISGMRVFLDRTKRASRIFPRPFANATCHVFLCCSFPPPAESRCCIFRSPVNGVTFTSRICTVHVSELCRRRGLPNIRLVGDPPPCCPTRRPFQEKHLGRPTSHSW